MSGRNNLVAYDPAVARQAAQAELRSKVAPRVLDCNKPGAPPIQLSAEALERQRAAAAMEIEKIKRRLDERRRRDPTFKETALDLDRSKMLPFSKFRDYYAELGVEQYCTPAELKDAYKKLSLKLHPDKMGSRPAQERLDAEQQLHTVKEAYAVLSEPATRQAYDKARDRLEAQYEAGVVVTDEATKPPPSCVEVVLSLEEMFCGCLKYQRYKRGLFLGTKWERKDDDVFTLKVRPGETPGATFWFKEKGEVSTAGKSDLVFITHQTVHDVYERVGVDLWYRHESPMPAEALLFTAIVPTLELERNWQGPVKKEKGNYGYAIAVGNCLAAALGYDRSGWGEAIVRGKGVPLLAAGEDARRGTGELDDKEQELRYGLNEKKTVATMAKEEAAAFVGAERGDLVVKFAVSPPGKRRVVHLPPEIFRLPPIGLFTSQGGFGRPRSMPPTALRSSILGSLLPAVLASVAIRHAASTRAADAMAAEPSPPSAAALAAVGLGPEAAAQAVAVAKKAAQRRLLASLIPPASMLTAVLLIVGSEAGGRASVSPSAVAAQVMDVWKAVLPQMRWRVIHMTRGTEMPLLPDEEDEVENASVVLIEAVHASQSVEPKMIFDPRVGKLVPKESEPVLYETPAVGEDSFATKEYRVVRQPGVRVRSAPSYTSEVMGLLRAGSIVAGTAVSASGWVELVGGRGFVRAFSSTGPLLSATGSGVAALEAESEEDEVLKEEKKVSWMRAEREYLDGGLSAAREVLTHETALAIYRCHCSGGVIIALDHACSLLGRAGNEPDAAAAEERTWPRLLPYLVGLPAVKPPASRHRISWRRLRGIAAHSQVDDCSLGLAAVGLPPGSATIVRTDRGCAVWPSLGSATPKKMSAVDAREREARVLTSQRARKVERERTKALSQLEEAFKTASMPWPPAPRENALEPCEDYAGVLRGQCPACNACPGYQPATSLAHAPSLAMLCVCCGCDCSTHEALRAREKVGEELPSA